MSPYRLPDSLLEQLLLEDTPYGDATSFALGLNQHQGVMHCTARYDMVLCGSEEAQRMAELRGLHIVLPARPSGAACSAPAARSCRCKAQRMRCMRCGSRRKR